MCQFHAIWKTNHWKLWDFDAADAAGQTFVPHGKPSDNQLRNADEIYLATLPMGSPETLQMGLLDVSGGVRHRRPTFLSTHQQSGFTKQTNQPEHSYKNWQIYMLTSSKRLDMI